jgi:tRNA threonylcarbamoyladenosine biosynthesis protein TsaB
MTGLAPFDNAIVCPILDARMKEVYAGIYRFQNKKRETLHENFLGGIQDFLSLLKQYAENLPIIVFGEGALLYQQFIMETFPHVILGESWWSHPRASSVGIEALHLWEQGYKKEIDDILPIYLRLSQPEERKRKCQSPLK